MLCGDQVRSRQIPAVLKFSVDSSSLPDDEDESFPLYEVSMLVSRCGMLERAKTLLVCFELRTHRLSGVYMFGHR